MFWSPSRLDHPKSLPRLLGNGSPRLSHVQLTPRVQPTVSEFHIRACRSDALLRPRTNGFYIPTEEERGRRLKAIGKLALGKN